MLKTTASEKKAEHCAQNENKDDIDCTCYRGVNNYIELSKKAIATYNQEKTAYDAAVVNHDKEKDNYRKSLSDALIKLKSYDCDCCGPWPFGQNCPCDFDKYTIAEGGSQLRDEFFLETKDLRKVGQGPHPDAKGLCGCKVSCKIKESTQLARLNDWLKKYPKPKPPTLNLPKAEIKCINLDCKNVIENINENSDLEDIRQECNISIYEEQQGRKKKDGGGGEGKGEGGSGGKGAPNLSLGLIFGIVLCGLGVLLLIIGLILNFRGK